MDIEEIVSMQYKVMAMTDEWLSINNKEHLIESNEFKNFRNSVLDNLVYINSLKE